MERAIHESIADPPSQNQNRKSAQNIPSDPAAGDPQSGQGSMKTGLWRRVDKSTFVKRLDTLRQHPVRYIDALPTIDLTKALDKHLLSLCIVQLTLNPIILVAQRIDDVHCQHHVIELMR
jgi:hypothetical protein